MHTAAAAPLRRNEMITVSNKLEGLAPRRKAAGLTQAQLAEKIGVTRASIANWETGVSWPPVSLLPVMADVLICPIEDLYVAPETE